MAPFEGRRSKKQPAGQQLGVTPLGADSLPAQSEHTKSNGLAWIFVLLLMLIFSYTVMLSRYGNGWVRHITTRVSLIGSSKPMAASTALTSALSKPVLELGSSSVEKQPVGQQDGALGGEDVARLERHEEAQPQQQQKEEKEQEEGPPQQQPEQEQEGVKPASESAKEQAGTPEPAVEDSAAAKPKPESPPPDDKQPEGSAVEEAKDKEELKEDEGAAASATDEQNEPEGAKNEEEDEEARRKAAELQAHKERYQAALAEARNPPRVPPVDISHIPLDPDVEDPSGEPEPRLAIALNGQLKNVEPQHVQSFTDQVLKPLLAYFNHVDVYLHSFNAVTFNNPRNGEDHWPINVTRSLENIVAGLRAVEPAGRVKIKGVSITDLQDADAEFKPLDYYLAHGDPYNNEGLSLFNSLRSYYSLQAVTKLWQDKRLRATLEDGTEQLDEYYQAVVYARSDLFYYDPLPLIPQKWNETTKDFYFETKPDGSNEWAWDELVQNNTLYTAPFDESYGLNDRFAYGRPPVMRLYGNRGTTSSIDAFFERYPDQSLWVEPFLYKNLVEMHGVQRGRIERFQFARVRATGYYGGSRHRRSLLAKGEAPTFEW